MDAGTVKALDLKEQIELRRLRLAAPSAGEAAARWRRPEPRAEHVVALLDPMLGVNLVTFPDGGPLRA